MAVPEKRIKRQRAGAAIALPSRRFSMLALAVGTFPPRRQASHSTCRREPRKGWEECSSIVHCTCGAQTDRGSWERWCDDCAYVHLRLLFLTRGPKRVRQQHMEMEGARRERSGAAFGRRRTEGASFSDVPYLTELPFFACACAVARRSRQSKRLLLLHLSILQ